MNKVEAIKFNDDIVKMYEALKIKSERDYLFFKLAIHYQKCVKHIFIR